MERERKERKLIAERKEITKGKIERRIQVE